MSAIDSLKRSDIAGIVGFVFIALVLGCFLFRYPNLPWRSKTNLGGEGWQCIDIGKGKPFCIRISPSN